MMRLAIVGNQSKAFDYDGWRTDVSIFVKRQLKLIEPELVISGGESTGVDAIAIEAARVLGYPTKEIKPAFYRWRGPGGFEERNYRIARECTHLLRIAGRRQGSYGSGWTADRAEELDRLVWRVALPRDRGQSPPPEWLERL